MAPKSLAFLCLIMTIFCTEASIIPTQSSTNDKSWLSLGNVADSEGNSVGDSYGKTLDQCKDLCDLNPSCMSFVFAAHAGACHQKDRFISMNEPTKIVSGYLTYFKVCDQSWVSLGNVADSEGNSVGDSYGETLDECKDLCDLNPNCMSFVFAAHAGACHQKDKFISMNEPTKIVSGYLTYLKVCDQSWVNLGKVADSEGSSVGDSYGKTLDQCKELCDLNPNCNSFVFAAHAGACHQKDKHVRPDEPTKIVSGYLTYFKESDPSWLSLGNVADSEGSSVGDSYGKTLDQCKELCDLNQDCNSFVFAEHAGACHQKDKYITPNEPTKVVSGYLTYFKYCNQITA